MNSRERLRTALRHQEPDRIPFDLGSTQVTGIHEVAYRNLRAYLGLPPVKPQMCDVVQGLALPDDDVIEKLPRPRRIATNRVQTREGLAIGPMVV